MLFKTEFVDDLDNTALRKKFPTINLVGKWYDKIVDFTEQGITDNKYGPLKRVMRRYREYIAGDFLPTVTTEDMELQAIGL